MAGIEPDTSPMRPVERPALKAAIARALHFEPGRMIYWMDGAGPATYRVVRAAGLGLLRGTPAPDRWLLSAEREMVARRGCPEG
jgi:hypothetical protein